MCAVMTHLRPHGRQGQDSRAKQELNVFLILPEPQFLLREISVCETAMRAGIQALTDVAGVGIW